MKHLERMSTFRNFVGELTATYRRTELPRTRIKSSRDAADFARQFFDSCMDDHEEVKVLHLSNLNGVVNVHEVASGSEVGTIVPVKMILQQALLIKTSALIMVHNHPSGKLEASTADKQITDKLKKACEICDLRLLDSLIITRESYLSMADEGLM